jgi:hypothetical protein
MTQASIFDSAQVTHKKPTQAQKMLRLLQDRGRLGVRNYEFVTLLHILNYKGRKHELGKKGYNIEVKYRPDLGEGVYLYTLLAENEAPDVS